MSKLSTDLQQQFDFSETYTGFSEVADQPFIIKIVPQRDALLSEAGKITMKGGQYMLPHEESPQEAFARGACAYASNAAHAQRLYDYVSQCWFMFATPVLSSAANPRGCPISCFLNYVGDSRESIGNHWNEVLWLSTEGGGVGTDWSSIRSVGTKTSRGTHTPGLIPFLKATDSITMASVQGGVRRGATAVYLDVSHPEIEEFLECRRPTGGDMNRKMMNLHNAVNIPDAFMEAVIEGKAWDLIDPNSKQVVKSVDARGLWKRILEVRLETGEPYLHFIDTSNKALPPQLKEKGLRINNSNLCNEIYLPTNDERTAVCCLSSVNLEFFDDWADNHYFIGDLIEMLDNVLTVFISKAPPELAKAVYSATQERSLGLGAMGFHLYLQKKGIVFDTPMASGQNRKIFSQIKLHALTATKRLAMKLGEAPDMAGSGLRNAHLLAIAPNASSAIICNSSPSIEPFNANIFVQKTKNGAFVIKNKELDRVLKEEYTDLDTEAVWMEILKAEGSVQELDFLSEHHKALFRTAFEIDQRWIVDHASSRQPFLCQGQSVNLFIPPGSSFNFVHALHKQAWEGGLKGLYYVRSKNLGKVTQTSNKIVDTKSSTCLSCEG